MEGSPDQVRRATDSRSFGACTDEGSGDKKGLLQVGMTVLATVSW